MVRVSARELRSLDIQQINQRAGKRKRRASSEDSSTKRSPSGMDYVQEEEEGEGGDIFEAFHKKVSMILKEGMGEEVLSALSNLAAGEDIILNMHRIPRIHGLGQQQQRDSSQYYLEAMMLLLKWGIREFPVNPRFRGARFWLIMKRFDGPDGLNQLLLSHAQTHTATPIYVRDQGPGLVVGLNDLPSIVIKEGRGGSVAAVSPNHELVRECLYGELSSRTVVATKFNFGWQSVHVKCDWLFVDTEMAEGFTQPLVQQKLQIWQRTPTVIMQGRIQPVGTTQEEMKEVLEPSGLADLELSQRRTYLRSLRHSTVRMVNSIGTFHHGQSISLKGTETKGSVGVFLTPSGDDDNQSYAVTAAHVVLGDCNANEIPHPPPPSGIITPGGLDILTRLQMLYPNKGEEGERRFLLDMLNHECGEVVQSHIGSNKAGWRVDWALMKLNTGWEGKNGNWFEGDEMADLWITAQGKYKSFTGAEGVTTARDPVAGEMCLKDGASTGLTAGQVGPAEALIFWRGTSNAVPAGKLLHTPPNMLDHARAYIVMPHQTEVSSFGKPGNSGSAVFLRRRGKERVDMGWIPCICPTYRRHYLWDCQSPEPAVGVAEGRNGKRLAFVLGWISPRIYMSARWLIHHSFYAACFYVRFSASTLSQQY